VSIADLPRSANPVTWIWATAINRIFGGKRPFDISPGQRTFGPFLQDVARQVSPIPSAQAQTIPNTGYQTPPTMGPPDPLLNPPVPGGGSSGSSGQSVPPGGGGGGPRIPRGGTPPINPNFPPVPVRVNWWPAAVISVIAPYVIPGAKRAGELGYEWWQQRQPLPKGPKGRKRRNPNRGPGPRATPAQTESNPLGLPPTIIINMPSPPAEPRARPPKAERGRSALNIPNVRRRYPITVASSGPIVARAPAQIPRTRGQQAAAIARIARPLVMPLLPSLLALGGGKSSSSRRRDPLTQPQVDNPILNPGGAPATGGLTLDQSSVATYISGSFGGGSQGAVGTNTCECKAPRKKRRKKKRSVCYSGTYIERADGTRKSKKRKVQCL
jgi:hypothetical protein